MFGLGITIFVVLAGWIFVGILTVISVATNHHYWTESLRNHSEDRFIIVMGTIFLGGPLSLAAYLSSRIVIGIMRLAEL